MPLDPYTDHDAEWASETFDYVADCRADGSLDHLFAALTARYRRNPVFRGRATEEALWEMAVEGDFGPVPNEDTHHHWWAALALRCGLIRADETFPHA
jgi:hypothetical protein